MKCLQAYDRSLVRLRGSNAATNFSISDYRTDLADYYKMQQVWQDFHIELLSSKNSAAPYGCCKTCTMQQCSSLINMHMGMQKVLQGDGSSGEELLKSGSEFERWIKLGLSSTEESQGITAEG